MPGLQRTHFNISGFLGVFLFNTEGEMFSFTHTKMLLGASLYQITDSVNFIESMFLTGSSNSASVEFTHVQTKHSVSFAM